MSGRFIKIQSTYWDFIHEGDEYRLKFDKHAPRRMFHKRRRFSSFAIIKFPKVASLNSLEWADAYLYVQDEKLIEKLANEIRTVVRNKFLNWPKYDYFFNRSFSMEVVITNGGLFFSGPVEIAHSIQKALGSFGVFCSLIPCGRRLLFDPDSLAYVFDGGLTYVLVDRHSNLYKKQPETRTPPASTQ